MPAASDQRAPVRTRSRWAGWVGPVLFLGTIGLLVARLGTGPVFAGLARVDLRSVGAALVIGAVTTLCCAWRWTLVARAVGASLSLVDAVTACYRSQLTNVLTPGGLLGDVDRALRHGRALGNHAGAVRSVVLDRVAGQVVLLAGGAAALTVLPSPVREPLRTGAVAVLAIVPVASLLPRTLRRQVWSRLRGGMLWTMGDQARIGRCTVTGAVLASAGAVGGYVLTFLVAARAAGATAPADRLVPLAAMVLVGGALPSVAGWGPREGIAAWSFGVAGLGAAQGVAVAVVYGVLVLCSALPGAVLPLAVAAGRARRPGVRGGRHAT